MSQRLEPEALTRELRTLFSGDLLEGFLLIKQLHWSLAAQINTIWKKDKALPSTFTGKELQHNEKEKSVHRPHCIFSWVIVKRGPLPSDRDNRVQSQGTELIDRIFFFL